MLQRNREVLAPTFWSFPCEEKDVTTYELTTKSLKAVPFLSFLWRLCLRLVALCKCHYYSYIFLSLHVKQAFWHMIHTLLIFVQFSNMCQKAIRFRQKVHRQVAFVTLSSELWHLLEFNKFPVWELPFSA